jgi:uncharacterized membrane protein
MLPIAVVILGIILLILIDVSYLSQVKSTVYAPLSNIMRDVDPIPAVASWILIFFGCYYLGVGNSTSRNEAALRGAMFGFFSYGIYNTTNLATIPALSLRNKGVLKMAILDTLWGSLLCAGTSAALWSVQ